MESKDIDWDLELKYFRQIYKEKELNKGTNADKYWPHFYKNICPPKECNTFPNNYQGVFNGIKLFKEILYKIREDPTLDYLDIHKGTPFFYIGWFNFLIGNYNEAIFYIDAAFNEDRKNHTIKKLLDSDAWSPKFLMLDHEFDKFLIRFTHTTISEILNEELNNFSLEFSKFRVIEFIDFFIKDILFRDNLLPGDAALITTFYTFILEKKDILLMIKLREVNNGTIEPMILHLYKGCLIFESLLKKYHNQFKNGNLGIIFNNPDIQELYDLDHGNECTENEFLSNILDIIANKNYNKNEIAFYTTCKLRNTLGHKLTWDDVFNCENYKKLYQQILNAILIVIQKNSLY